ncbi:MAG: hypothetical protein KAH32_05150 [Chlamydiia bacterium]|nr:hypothetical protein [Chlamydiia bacterium]
MKIRGDLKILHDLIVTTAANDAVIGNVLSAVNAEGKVRWSNLIVTYVESLKTYEKGSLVTNSTGTDLYLAIDHSAPGANLSDSAWKAIGGSAGGAGGVIEYPYRVDFPPVGISNTIYIDNSTGYLFRWKADINEYVNTAAITEEIVSLVDVGGIRIDDPVTEKSTLSDFINQLLRPFVADKKTADVTYSLSLPNSKLRVGEVISTNYTDTYFPGTVTGYDVLGNIASVDLKGIATITHSPAAGTTVTIAELNTFTGTATYAEGTDPIYDSTGQPGTVNRSSGTLVSTFTVTGFNPLYVGVTSKTYSALITDMQGGILPTGTYTREYITNEISRIPENSVGFNGGNINIFIAVPRGKYQGVKVVTEKFDDVIDTTDPRTGTSSPTVKHEFDLTYRTTAVQYDLYFRTFGGWPIGDIVKMKEISINNI